MIVTLESNCQVLKTYTRYSSIHSIPTYLSKRNEGFILQRQESVEHECSTLFAIAQNWKWPKYPQTSEWMKQILSYLYNEILLHNTR
jgi:hypothetical protein